MTPDPLLRRIKNVGFDVYIGRGQYEEQSTRPKYFIPLGANHPGDGTFECLFGINPKYVKLQSRKAAVWKAETDHHGASAWHPAAVIEKSPSMFQWEIDGNSEKTVIRDPDTLKVWTLLEAQSGSADVTLEDYCEGDDRQLWKMEPITQ